MTTSTPDQAAAPPIPTPHQQLRELDFFLGGWKAPGLFHETPFGPQKPIEMQIDGSSEGRGFWITVRTTELPTAENPAPLTARYVWGYDSAADEFVADWYDSNGGRRSSARRGGSATGSSSSARSR